MKDEEPVAELICRCGDVRGRLIHAEPAKVNRTVCYCDDCQAFLHHLGRADLLDAHGGTDIVQFAPARFEFLAGEDRLAGMRLSPKGLLRFHTTCCRTPVGNTVSPSIPFVGAPAAAFRDADVRFGPPRTAILGRFAVGTPPAGSTRLDPRLVVRVARLILGWKLGGRTWPHPFFDRGAKVPRYPVTVISRDAREALRPLCGPIATEVRRA